MVHPQWKAVQMAASSFLHPCAAEVTEIGTFLIFCSVGQELFLPPQLPKRGAWTAGLLNMNSRTATVSSDISQTTDISTLYGHLYTCHTVVIALHCRLWHRGTAHRPKPWREHDSIRVSRPGESNTAIINHHLWNNKLWSGMNAFFKF